MNARTILRAESEVSPRNTAPSNFSRTTEVLSWPYYVIHVQTRAERFCRVDGCKRMAEAFCFSLKHQVCGPHHKPYHDANGNPIGMEKMPEFPLWK